MLDLLKNHNRIETPIIKRKKTIARSSPDTIVKAELDSTFIRDNIEYRVSAISPSHIIGTRTSVTGEPKHHSNLITVRMDDTMIIVSSSYGNDSLALIQWVKNNDLQNVFVTFCNTGWAAPGWSDRVAKCEEWVKSLGFTPVQIPSMGMEELVKMKKGFPSNQHQFCTMHLKGVPFLKWCDEHDPNHSATVVVGKRRAESKKRANTPEYVLYSEYHGDRVLWHPLYNHTHTHNEINLFNKLALKYFHIVAVNVHHVLMLISKIFSCLILVIFKK